jgi:hypothetical protein
MSDDDKSTYEPGVISEAGVELLDRVKTKYPRRAGLIDGVEATTKEQP